MQEIVYGGYYQHYKNKPYQVIAQARHSDDQSEVVFYKTLYECDLGIYWVRPLLQFLENVDFEGQAQPRFRLVSPPVDFVHYHSHIYYSLNEKPAAEKLHSQLKLLLPQDKVQVHRLIDKPIGPHPLPMFEVDFVGTSYLEVVQRLSELRHNLKILIHPLSGDAWDDHTKWAQFLGGDLKLNLDVL